MQAQRVLEPAGIDDYVGLTMYGYATDKTNKFMCGLLQYKVPWFVSSVVSVTLSLYADQSALPVLLQLKLPHKQVRIYPKMIH